MENLLNRTTCYLVQSGRFNENFENNTGLYSIVNLYDMGAAEFEWGALPKSTQRMLTNIEFYEVFTFPEYKNAQGEPLMVYAPKMFIEHISAIVENLAKGQNLRLKARCDIPEYMEGKKRYGQANFWWDVQNDFYVFFGEEKRDLILEAVRAMRERSINEVEVGDWDQLSEYYLEENPDLNDEAKEFLSHKKDVLVKRLINALNNRIEQKNNNSNN